MKLNLILIALVAFCCTMKVQSQNTFADHRITSYNVCYTKLLRRLLAPAPPAIAIGTQPRIKASEVMTMGRSRSRAASTAASTTDMRNNFV